MTIRAIVVDDEPHSRDVISRLIDTYCPEATVVAEAGNAEQAYEAIRKHKPELVFLDIEMPHGSGFDLLKRLGKIDFEVIFITAFDQYALQAIKACALDYLLKPISIDELTSAVHKVAEKMKSKSSPDHILHLIDNLVNSNKHSNKIALPSLHGLEFININKIIRCEADGNYTRIITDEGKTLLTTRNLKEYENLLPATLFFRAHYSHIINLEHITRYQRGEGGYVVMSDNSTVDIAKRKKKDFLDRFHAT